MVPRAVAKGHVHIDRRTVRRPAVAVEIRIEVGFGILRRIRPLQLDVRRFLRFRQVEGRNQAGRRPVVLDEELQRPRRALCEFDAKAVDPRAWLRRAGLQVDEAQTAVRIGHGQGIRRVGEQIRARHVSGHLGIFRPVETRPDRAFGDIDICADDGAAHLGVRAEVRTIRPKRLEDRPDRAFGHRIESHGVLARRERNRRSCLVGGSCRSSRQRIRHRQYSNRKHHKIRFH